MINRERLTNTFCELVSIDSPSGEEEEVSKYIEAKLTKLGFILLKDDYGNLIAKTKSNNNNLILSAHMDTVEPGRGIIPVVEKDIISKLSYDQLKLIKSTIHYEKPISAPIKSGEKIGSLIINVSGKPPIIVPLVADEAINNINPIIRIFAAIKYLIFGTSLDEI